MVTTIDRDKLIVTQANRLVEASYSMTLEEKRIVLLMVSLVRQEDNDFFTYRIPITDIRDYLGLTTNTLYDNVKRVSKALMSRVLELPEEQGGWLQIGWVSSARYIPKGVRGADVACLELKFDPDLKPYLLELKAQFSSYMLQNIAGLRSFYSIRMYELLNSRRRLKRVVFEIEELKVMLKIDGKYDNYKDMRERVILIAQKELSEKTDLTFDFEETKKGRKVVSIIFNICDNEPSKPPRSVLVKQAIIQAEATGPTDERQPQLLPPTAAEIESAQLYNEAIAEGVQNGVRENIMRDLLSTRNPIHVIENIEIARKRHMNAKSENPNLGGLTVAAITSDYAADGREKRQKATDKVKARERAKVAKELLERIETAATVARRHDLTARLAALPEAERDALRAAFVAEVEEGKHGDHTIASFRTRGWKATGVEIYFRIFAADVLNIGSEDKYKRAEAERLGQDYDGLCRLAGGKG